jgi:hypothetical protein
LKTTKPVIPTQKLSPVYKGGLESSQQLDD